MNSEDVMDLIYKITELVDAAGYSVSHFNWHKGDEFVSGHLALGISFGESESCFPDSDGDYGNLIELKS